MGSSALTGGLANPVLSFLEDVVTVALFVLAVLVPLAVAGLVLLGVSLLARRRSAASPAHGTA
jgi:hypothetical protein